jgi:hypothetical protein
LSWPSALVLGAILVVTGPTVVIPLLRNARLAPRAGALLRWEAILADPIGALLAVLVFEAVLVTSAQLAADDLALHVAAAALWVVIGGYSLGRLMVLAFVRGRVPEFLKPPVLVAAVLGSYSVSGLLLEESGLLTVTVLGITIGNSRIASLSELRRFKEFVTVLLVSGVFVALTDQGIPDGGRLVPLTFAVVIATVLLHGFTLAPLARLLELGATGPQGVLIVGGSPWATAFAEQLDAMALPVTIVDRNWNHLTEARYRGIDVYYGEILSEPAEHHLDLQRFGHLVAATDNDDYNALVCTDFGPEFGRSNVFQIGRPETAENRHNLSVTLGGRPLLEDADGYRELHARLASGWEFRKTTLTRSFDQARLEAELGDEGRVLLARRGDRLLWTTPTGPPKLQEGDVVLSFAPAAG